jgi:hypothetical protein
MAATFSKIQIDDEIKNTDQAEVEGSIEYQDEEVMPAELQNQK